jgi:hypothetical protein
MNRPGLMAGALKRISAARWKAHPLKSRADDAATTEYLYVPCVRTGYNGHSAETHRWVQEIQIVKKTAKLIYYASDSWKRRDAVVSPGCVDREQFETDTRCRGEDRCRHGYPAGVIPIPGDHHRSGPAGQLFFATREAAENHLSREERQRAGQAIREAARKTALITELRRAMADAHPDHGGTAEQFIQARRRYQTALRKA